MAVNVENVFIGGSDDDALYLGPYGTDLSTVTLTTDLSTIPALVDVGWLNDGGLTMALNDSVKKLTGHQGKTPVRTTMESSETTWSATLLESVVETYGWYMDATVTTTGGVATVTARKSRRVKRLVAVWDTYDADDPSVHWRYVATHVELGARGEVPIKKSEFKMYPWTLEVLSGWKAFTNAPGMVAL